MIGRLWQLCAGIDCTAAASEAYRRLWDGQLPARRSLCRHRGEATGELKECASCRGRVGLKVFACGHPMHSNCPTTTEMQCRQCPDYEGQP